MPRAGWTGSATGKEILEKTGILAARRAALLRAGTIMQREWKEILNQPGGGRQYGAHQASAPGSPPAPDRGLLRASVLVAWMRDRVRVGMGGPRGRIGLALEYGVNTAGSQVGPHPAQGFKIAPRPHARPARDASARRMTRGIVAELKTKAKRPNLTK